MMTHKFDSGVASQESQYEFPYHYIPILEDGNFSQHLYWSWGINYLSGLDLVYSSLSKEKFNSLVDMGCGDGRFLFGLEKRIKNKDLLGVDTSQVAIDIAKAMSPMVSYKCFDICSVTQPLEKFDIATLIEVLEHIPIKEVDNFVMSIANYLKPSGKLILTVPHTNKPVTFKHYQHFDSKSLQKCLSPFFEIETMEFFEKKSRIFNRIINPILRNNLFILNNKFLLNTIFKYYRKYLLTCNEDKCGRILFIARKK